jgi:hypothetical protein
MFTATVPVPPPVFVVPTGGVTVTVFTKLPVVVAAVTCTVTVTAPPDGIVTDPCTVVPLMLNVPVLAPPLTWLLTSVAVPQPAGSVSAKLPPKSVLGPALPITKLKVFTPPANAALELASLVTLRFTSGETLKEAVAAEAFEPTEVVNEPAPIVLTTEPVRVLVTTVDTMQEEFGGISVPAGTVKLPPPTETAGTPDAHVVVAVEV